MAKFVGTLVKREATLKELRCANLPETAGISKSKVHAGSTTEGLEMLSAEVRSEIQKKWEAVVTPVL